MSRLKIFCFLIKKLLLFIVQMLEKPRFEVEFLEEAIEFLDNLNEKARAKIIYNIKKASFSNDPELFKKISDDIWEFRTLFQKTHYRLFAFWDKSRNNKTLVITTHGIIKKTNKTPKIDLERAESLRMHYLNLKK
jgi:phage-related protein